MRNCCAAGGMGGGQFDKEASQTRELPRITRDFGVRLRRRAGAPTSLRKGGLLRMTTSPSANCAAREIEIE
jgi:hypothetical protein